MTILIALGAFMLGCIFTAVGYNAMLTRRGMVWDRVLRMWRWADKKWGYCPACKRGAKTDDRP